MVASLCAGSLGVVCVQVHTHGAHAGAAALTAALPPHLPVCGGRAGRGHTALQLQRPCGSLRTPSHKGLFPGMRNAAGSLMALAPTTLALQLRGWTRDSGAGHGGQPRGVSIAGRPGARSTGHHPGTTHPRRASAGRMDAKLKPVHWVACRGHWLRTRRRRVGDALVAQRCLSQAPAEEAAWTAGRQAPGSEGWECQG